MKKILFILLAFGLSTRIMHAQINPKKFRPFIGQQEIINSSGPGLKASSGDILLELKEPDDEDTRTLLVLRMQNGNLKKIASNSNLLMGPGMLGASGGGSATLSNNTLSVDYGIGSGSAYSSITIDFVKGSDGQYYFQNYISSTSNYGVENLFAREQITSSQTGKIDFEIASENLILEKGGETVKTTEESINENEKQFIKYIPEDWLLAGIAVGDLNKDAYKKDALLMLYNETDCMFQLLLQEPNGKYKKSALNTTLIGPDGDFNINNFKLVIKNGFFTVEQRVATLDDNFDHRYLTFKYNASVKNWMIHRYAVEHYSGFNPKPNANVTQVNKEDLGDITFEKIDHFPDEYYFEKKDSEIRGTLIEKQFYGSPNYGETPEKDEQVKVYILKTDFPIGIIDTYYYDDDEMKPKTVYQVQEIQVYTLEPTLKLKDKLNKRVSLKGVFHASETGHHYAEAIFEVNEIK